MMLAEPGQELTMKQLRCPASLRRKPHCFAGETNSGVAADLSVILAYHKLRDSLNDDGFWKKLFDKDYFNKVKSIQGMPDWEEGLINISPETLLLYSTSIISSKSTYISLAMYRITADKAIPGVHLYINENDHSPPHVLSRAHNKKEANFNFNGSLMNGIIDKRSMRLTSQFIKSHKAEIERANTQIQNGEKPNPLIQ
jgi:hypothetical protein